MKIKWVIFYIIFLFPIIYKTGFSQVIYSNSFELSKNTAGLQGDKSNSSWFIRNSNTKENLNDVVMLDSSTAIVVGNNGAILKTTDSGETWKNTAPPVFFINSSVFIMNWKSVVFYDSINGIAAGESNILLTTNGGEGWQFLNSPSLNNFSCIGKTSLNNIYVGDDSGYIYNSIDTGKTWTSEHPTLYPIHSIYQQTGPYIFGQEIFALTSQSLLIKSDYPSTSWRDWGALGYFQGLGSEAFRGGFSEEGTEFIVGVQGDLTSTPTIIRLRPPDSHWYSVGPGNGFGELRGLSIPSSIVIYTCGSNGKILKTTDSGDYWFQLNTSTSRNLNSIYFFDNNRGFAVGDSGTILFTSSGGISSGNSAPSPFHLITPANEDTMLIMRSITFKWQKAIDPDNNPVYYTLLISKDSCATWSSYGPVTDTTSLQVQSSAQIPGRYFWTVIANDGIDATPGLDVFAFTIINIAGVDKNGDYTPTEFILQQNYPNPFNPTTNFEFTIADFGLVTLKIYDILGNEVATIVNKELSAGNYKYQWNANSLASGLYFYRLEAGNFVDTKKLILIK